MKKNPLYLAQSVLLMSMLSACASPMVTSDRSGELRHKLTQLQNDPNLSPFAPEALADAERAVRKVEQPQVDEQTAKHLDFVAQTKLEIAEAKAREGYLLEQRKTMAKDTADARLASRTLEADIANQRLASSTVEADQANQRADRLAADLAALKAKPGPKGMVVTLGDVLFKSGQATLQDGLDGNLSKLYDFMVNNPQAKLLIVGHTDSQGMAQSNYALSEMRANAVMAYLQNRGIASDRMTANGMGESSPISSNESSAGRQQNRRVEVIIFNT
ncbi:MAG: OmpA family protein [Limnobacter sp.]|nr:OmpA family protein [Limnobacter sp.]